MQDIVPVRRGCRLPCSRRWLAGAAVLAGAATLLAVPAAARLDQAPIDQTQVAQTPPAAADQPAPSGQAPSPGATVVPRPVDPIDGFRSARFGMTEAEVLAAIRQDFTIPEADVARETNTIERTTALAVTVNDLVPDGGPARVVYILGYQTHTLIQVNAVWGSPVNPDYNPAAMAMAGNVLQAYFLGRGYAPNTQAANVPLPDGSVLLFAGSDGQGRQVTLTLRAPAPAAAAATPPAEGDSAAPRPPAYLRLSYIKDPNNPDVFRLPPGSF